MSPFLPLAATSLYGTLAIVAGVTGIGYAITKLRAYKIAITCAWLFVFLSIAAEERLTVSENPGFRMIAIILTTLFAMKIVVTVESYKGKGSPLSPVQWTAFVAGWFGMKPKLFETLGQKPLVGARPLLIFGITRILAGITILFLVKWIGIQGQSFPVKFLLSALLLSGISLILHFGLLNVSAGMWRLSGVNTTTLFRSPLSSLSLTEFWGRRWNLAFSEMTAIGLYRPLKSVTGVTLATVIAFLFSGILHEMAISIPVMTGLGLPLLYFLIHGVLMLIEKWMDRKGITLLKNKIVGRIWVLFWLAAPMPVLFHKEFIKQVVWPIVG